MENLFIKSDYVINNTPTSFLRKLYGKIDWNDRLIGVLGARGTGKTTLLLQRAKLQDSFSKEGVYITLDDIYFSNNQLYDFVVSFRQKGGRYLFLDEVHKYPTWAREIKNIYDTFKDISIVFTGSSLIDIYQEEADLSRRAIFYELGGLSFREYLYFQNVAEFEPISLDKLITDHKAIALSISQNIRPLQFFEAYLKQGYYPFFNENTNTYLIRLQQIVRFIIETELSFIKQVDAQSARKVIQLLAILASNVPFKPNISKLSEKTGISRTSLLQYLHYLERARLMNSLSAAGKSISILQKPDKIYLENPNLQYALAPSNVDKGSLRETFFLNQLRNAGYLVSLPVKGDFLVEEKWTIEVGGRTKDATQVNTEPDAFLALDDIESGTGNKIPLWLFGFLY